MNIEQLANAVVQRAKEWQVGYADAWAYLINKYEKGSFTFKEVEQFIINNG